MHYPKENRVKGNSANPSLDLMAKVVLLTKATMNESTTNNIFLRFIMWYYFFSSIEKCFFFVKLMKIFIILADDVDLL